MQFSLAVADLGEHDLSGQHRSVEQARGALLEVPIVRGLELIGGQPAESAHRVDEQLRIAAFHDRRDAEIEQRHQCCVNHQYNTDQTHPQSIDQSDHSTRMTRTCVM